VTLSNRFLSCCLKGAYLLYMALAASRVLDGAEGFEERGTHPALAAAVLSANLGLMLLPPMVSLPTLPRILR